jgi:hypothetical protein
MRSRLLVLSSCLSFTIVTAGCGGDDDKGGGAVPSFLTVSQVETLDGSSTLVAGTEGLPSGVLDLSTAHEFPGYASVQLHDGSLYVSADDFTITRYEIGATLEPQETINLADQGLQWLDESMFLDSQRAFFINGDQLDIVEWNPTTMTVTAETSIAGLKRTDWAHEYRGSFLRASDRTIFIYWTYTNDRVTFVNDFVLGVYKIDTGTLTIIEDDTCSATAGFGGFFDEEGDLYLIADNFGGFTRFGNFPDPKDACVLRIRADQDTLDPDYRFVPAQALGGLEPWGLYYAGDGIAYTTAVDPTKLNDYPSVFEFIFAPIHEGYTLDLRARTALRLDGVPPDGVGFDSVRFENQLLVPRSTGKVRIYDVENIDTTVYGLNSATRAATPQFTMPGYLNAVLRVR